MGTKDARPVTVVTGAAGALGSAVVRDLLQRGHRVAAVEPAASVGRLAGLGKDVLPLGVDTTSADGWDAAILRIEKELGPVSGAVLVAGGWQGGGPLHERKDDSIWQAMLSMNTESAYFALQALLPAMVRRTAGSIVVVGARPAIRPESGGGMAEYTASKAAVVALAQAVAAEVMPSGVRVNAVLPSTLDTAANRKAMPGADPSKWVAPESLAGVIAFLLSDEAMDISGAAIPVYGKS